MSGSPPSPDNSQPPHPPHNSSSSPDNSHIFASSPPLPTTGYDDPEDFHYFGDGFSDGEEQSSNEEQPDLPATPVRDLPRPNTHLQLPSLPPAFAHGADDPTFSQIDQLTTSRLKQDAIIQLINGAPVRQSRGVGDDLLDSAAPPVDAVTPQEIRRQRAAINAPRSQASQYPDPTPTYVFDNGYEERPVPDEMLRGTGGYAPAPASDPFAGPRPSLIDTRRNLFAEATRGTIYATNVNTAPVNQRTPEGYMPAQVDEDDDKDSPEREDEESSERDDTPTATRTTHLRSSGNTYTPRTRGNRVRPQRSDPYPRFLSTDPQAVQDSGQTHTIARRTRGSGRNLMALFDNSDTPRTRYRLRIESGRTGQQAKSKYHAANDEIPARLSLREICQNYPNHVWGTGLRLFMHENFTAEQIWNYLPDDVRMKGCKGRPHNYLQQAIGRQCDEMMEEDTGEKREVIKRTHDDDEEEERKPKKQKTAYTPGGRVVLAPAPSPSQLAFPQRSPTSPFVVQTQRGVAGPRGGFQRLPMTNTPLPAAGVARGQPSPTPSPPRTTRDLHRLINTELAIHRDHASERLQAQRGEVPAAEAQQLLNVRSYNSDQNMINRLLQHYQLHGNPSADGSVVGLMLWILSHRIGGAMGQAEVLAAQDINSVALNWYLAMLREITQQYRDLAEADKRTKA